MTAAATAVAGGSARSSRWSGRTAAGHPDDRAVADLVARLHQAHCLALVRTAKLLLRDQQAAEDVVQEAFLSLYRALPGLREHDNVLPYLRTAVVNGARSALRSRERALRRSARHEHQPPECSAESAALDRADRELVMAAVARLPHRAREVLVLRYYLDLADAEIASVLGVSRGTVSSTASRALAALGRELEEEL